MDDDLSFLSDDAPVIAGYLDNVAKRLPSYEKKLEGCQQVLINREFLASYKLASEFEDEIDRYLIDAALNWQLGLRFCNAGKNSEGIKLLLKSIARLNFCCGMISGKNRQESEIEDAKQKAKGGKAKAARFGKMKEEVIRLLQKNKVDGGWRKKTIAFKFIEDDLLLFVEKNGWPSAEDKDELNKSSVDKYANMQRLVMDWSRNDQGVKSAFDSVIQRKPKK